MKFRNGFVSNSSSSSFVIYGYRVDVYDIKSCEVLFDLFGINKEKLLESDDQLDYIIENLPKDVDVEYSYDSDIIVIGYGHSWESCIVDIIMNKDEFVAKFEKLKNSPYYNEKYIPQIYTGYVGN